LFFRGLFERSDREDLMKIKGIFTSVLCSFILALTVGGQDVRTLDTKVADILAQMPANDLNHRDRLMREMIGLGQNGIVEIATRLVPPSAATDAQVRFALGNLALFAGRPGREQDRLLVSKSFCVALEKAADPEIKAFLLEQLKFAGGEEAIPSIEPYLSDARLGEPAVQALIGSHTPAAIPPLQRALAKVSGKNRVAVVKALGEYRASSSLKDIQALIGGADADLQRAALFAVAEIASPSSQKILQAAAKKAGYGFDRTHAAAALVRYAGRLAEENQLKPAGDICRALIRDSIKAKRYENASSALSILVDTFGYETMPDLLAAMDVPDKAYRGAALRYAAQIKDIAATRRWLDKLQKAGPETQAEILLMLGRRGDRLAVPAMKSALESSNLSVRAAACEALPLLIGKAAFPPLLEVLKKAGPAELPVLQRSLETVTGQPEVPQLAAGLGQMSAASKAVALNLIGARKSVAHFDTIFGYTSDPEPQVRQAAFQAIRNVATPDRIPALIDLMYRANPGAEVGAVQEALASACAQSASPERTAKPILDAATGGAQKRERFYGVLARIAGAEALKAVSDEFTKVQGEARNAAFQAITSWKDHSTVPMLYSICAQGPAEYRDEAFRGYVRQIRGASITPDQKLLLLRKIMPLARNAGQKRQVIQALDGNRTLLTLLYVGSYLDDKEVQQEAAQATMNIALPPSGTREGMYGDVVRPLLEKTIQVITGSESDYDKENMRTWLRTMPAGPGYVPMFNGKDLTGWKGLVGNPLTRAKMSAEELSVKQAEAERKMRENWRVQDGAIVFNGQGDNLCSIKDYGDFEMYVDWRITKGGDSGIYLRGSPQVQIWDTARTDAGAQVGSGGLYNNQKPDNPSKPLVVADNAVGEWNTFYIKMIGERVTVYLNGELVVDNVVMENYWDRSIPIFPTGAIELQAHGSDLQFRNIYVHEIAGNQYNLTVEEQADGFQALFNGKNLDGWIGNKVDYRVEEGAIVIRPEGGGKGNLYTQKEYGDFIFRFEFQLTPGANNGIGIRAPLEGDAAYEGMEIQVLDDTAPIYAKLQPYQYHGSAYGIIPAKRGHLLPVGEWNREEIVVQGTRIKVVLNGTVIVDGDLLEASANGTMDHQNHPGLKRKSGYIGFLGHGSVVKFRNIRIRPL
jgi:HEAT repeat protein